ncbi:murein biosynthesis integral membrane protein MurJ [Gracilibacillus timonensis]|uniref:murein biosynthesis integral membrane protein MurJ n=1 Tax=Gracilibacillus timonensis TaxID=1816696 RepID=UPI000825531C|nr:murein biosynthesis integral membrane protein MurJ [Gracilibacillus timonensis]
MRKKIGISAMIMFISTILLKISGLARDILIANYFGDSYLAEAYLAAFIIPNMMILFMQNGMKEVFVPQYFQYKKKQAEVAFLSHIFQSSFVIGILLAILGMILAPFLIDLLYPAFNEETATVATRIMRILMIAVCIVCINAVLESYLDATYRYHLSALSQMFVWVTMIGFTILFVTQLGVYVLAWGYLLGSLISFLFKKLFIRRLQLTKHKLHIRLASRYYLELLPVGITIMIGQLNLMVDNVYASYFREGVITYVNYAKNLVHLPQTVIAAVVGAVLFAHISENYAKQNLTAFQQSLSRASQVTFFLTLPAVAGLTLILPAVIEMLFERGAFSANATLETARVGYFYAGSAFFFSINVVWNKALYTMGKGTAIFKIGLISIGLNILLNQLLTGWISYYGIPLASSLVGAYYSISTYLVYLKINQAKTPTKAERQYSEFIKIVLAAIAMASVILWMQQAIEPLHTIVQVVLLVAAGIIIYFGCCQLFRVKALTFLIRRLRD